MKSQSKASKAKAPDPEPSGTESVTVRVEREHLAKLDAIAKTMGLKRSPAIKVAIAEFIQRKEKNSDSHAKDEPVKQPRND